MESVPVYLTGWLFSYVYVVVENVACLCPAGKGYIMVHPSRVRQSRTLRSKVWGFFSFSHCLDRSLDESFRASWLQRVGHLRISERMEVMFSAKACGLNFPKLSENAGLAGCGLTSSQSWSMDSARRMWGQW